MDTKKELRADKTFYSLSKTDTRNCTLKGQIDIEGNLLPAIIWGIQYLYTIANIVDSP